MQVLLGYLPLDPTKWDESLAERRKIYQQWIKDLIVDLHENVHSSLHNSIYLALAVQIVDEMEISVRNAHEEWWIGLRCCSIKRARRPALWMSRQRITYVVALSLSLVCSLACSWCQPISCLTLVSRSR